MCAASVVACDRVVVVVDVEVVFDEVVEGCLFEVSVWFR